MRLSGFSSAPSCNKLEKGIGLPIGTSPVKTGNTDINRPLFLKHLDMVQRNGNHSSNHALITRIPWNKLSTCIMLMPWTDYSNHPNKQTQIQNVHKQQQLPPTLPEQPSHHGTTQTTGYPKLGIKKHIASDGSTGPQMLATLWELTGWQLRKRCGFDRVGDSWSVFSATTKIVCHVLVKCSCNWLCLDLLLVYIVLRNWGVNALWSRGEKHTANPIRSNPRSYLAYDTRQSNPNLRSIPP